jgi:hypothetical protein
MDGLHVSWAFRYMHVSWAFRYELFTEVSPWIWTATFLTQDIETGFIEL